MRRVCYQAALFNICWRAFVSTDEGAQMATLHIEHPITDLQTWLGAFTRFEDARRKAGVRAQRVRQPVDDDKYIYVSLDFDSV